MSEAEKPDELTLAIQIAKTYLLKAFSGEKIENLGLEEVKHDPYQHQWDITLGFNRPRDPSTLPNNFLQFAAAASAIRPPRIYKVVRVDMQNGEATSITNRKDD